MKRALYSLDDEEFITFLGRTQDVLSQHEIPYAFVGGVASQAHIASALCKQNKRTLSEMSHSSDIRIQDYLRATDDVDITLDLRKFGNDPQDVLVTQRVVNAVKDIADDEIYSSPLQNVVAIKLERLGAKRPTFRLGLNEDADSPDSELSLNFYYGPQDTNARWSPQMIEFENIHYYPFFDSAQTIAIPYGETSVIPLRVKGLEALLATKIARARPKDWADIMSIYQYNTQAGVPVNVSEVERLLCSPDPKYQVVNSELVASFEKFKTLIE